MDIEKRIPTVSEYLKLRKAVGWWDTEEDSIEEALKNSLFSVVAVESDKVIGVGRIVGDGGLYFYIQDLIVHPDYQNKGLGKQLMKELMNYIKGHAKHGAFIGLMAARGFAKYYESFGFKACDADAPGMFKVIMNERGHR